LVDRSRDGHRTLVTHVDGIDRFGLLEVLLHLPDQQILVPDDRSTERGVAQ
jgi:hypothetical protein